MILQTPNSRSLIKITNHEDEDKHENMYIPI